MSEKGLIYAVGIGPGGEKYMTGEALSAMASSDVICGYAVYAELVKPLFEEGGSLFESGPKEFFTTAMKQEVDRCRKAVEIAESGKTVSMVCSGDSGVYGMAGLLLELCEGKDIEVITVPGITAAISGAAVLGAPLGHDFCVISLSDLLTPWEQIENRLRCAAIGDFTICLYNPGSHKRKEYLMRACDILLEDKDPETICGLVRNIGREGEEKQILTLRELRDTEVDMFTTVFIGSSGTENLQGYMVTRRGYHKKTNG